MIIPLGFTEISADFEVLDPAPDLTGTAFTLPQIFSDVGVPFVDVEEVTAPIEAGQPYTLTIYPATNYPIAGSTLTVSCFVESPTPISGTILLRVLPEGSDTYTSTLALTASVSTTRTELSFNLPVETEGLLQIVAHPLLTPVIPTIRIRSEEYNQLAVKSNLSTLFVQPKTVGVANAVNVPQSVIQNSPFADVVPRVTENILRSTVVNHILDLAPTNPQPHGSSGTGLYKDLGIPAPHHASMHKKSPSEGLQRLLGMALDQVKRLEGWADKLLHQVHSDQSSLENSDLNLLLNLLPESLRSSVEHYAGLVQEAGKYAADVAQTYTADYANGNTIVKSHAVEQHNVAQFRTQTSSVFDVNSPSMTFSSQQSVTFSRFEHHVNDILQASNVHSFIRSEGKMTLMNNNSIQYTSEESAQYSPNHTQIMGSNVKYQDSELEQVGQASEVPIHPTKADPSKATEYGNSAKLVHRNYSLKTTLGEIVINAGTNIYLHALQGDVRISTATGKIRLDATQDVTVKSAAKVQLYSGASMTLGASQIQAVASSNVVIRGSIVLINSGGSLAVPTTGTPKLVTVAPRVFQPMQDPAPLTKETPTGVGPAGQNVPLTPEPNNTLAGSSKLGEFLTGGN